MKKILLAVLMAFLLAGCKSTSILNLYEQPVQGQMSMEQMDQCIMRGGTSIGWRINKIRDGLMEGHFYKGKHTATVSIPYSTKSYSIIYKSSVNMREEDNNIHKIYNRWIRNLDKSINANIVSESYGR